MRRVPIDIGYKPGFDRKQTREESSPSIYKKVALNEGGYVEVMQGYDETQSLAFIPGQIRTLVTAVVPPGGQVLLITHFANSLSDIAAWGYFTWSVQIDGNPVSSYSAITNQLASVNQMRQVGVDIIAYPGQTLTVVCTSDITTPANYDAVVSMIGVYGYIKREQM